MPERALASEEATVPGPYLTMSRERGKVTIWALGNDRHRVRAEGEIDVDHVVTGRNDAHEFAGVLAERLGPSTHGASARGASAQGAST
jgi:hypothetical protein